jgi:HK97 family phage major capsid protein
MTPEELDEVAKLQAAFKETEKLIAAREANEEMQAKLREPQHRVTRPSTAPSKMPTMTPRRLRQPEAAAAALRGRHARRPHEGQVGLPQHGRVRLAAMATKHGKPDTRILNAPTSFGSEGQNTDGGFAVPPDFRQEIMKQVMGEESLLSRCDQQITQSNSLSLPLDTVSPWDTSSGVLASWTGEGRTLAQSKPSLGSLETKLNKLTALVPLTDELVKDVSAMTRWLESKVPEKFTSALNTAIINGTGVGQPMGLLKSPPRWSRPRSRARAPARSSTRTS